MTSADFVTPRSEAFPPIREAHSSGVSWGAVIGGAFVMSSLYLILLALGAGFGLSAVSPWSNVGVSASTVGAAAIVWLIVIEIIAAAAGGYLAGRLRTKWTLIHTDEVYFRDTANGFLAWAVALVVSVVLLASAAASMAGSAAQAGASAEGVPPSETFGFRPSGTAAAQPQMYFVDALFRSARIASDANGVGGGDPSGVLVRVNNDAAVKAEAARILANSLRQPEMSARDQSYLAQLVATRTGLDQPAAEMRVSNVLAEAREADDAARKATAHLLLWLFLSLLMGAFSASFAATVGGRQRDHVKAAIPV